MKGEYRNNFSQNSAIAHSCFLSKVLPIVMGGVGLSSSDQFFAILGFLKHI